MDRAQHAKALRDAMHEARMTGRDLALLLGVSERSVSGWISETKPVMPRGAEQKALQKRFPGYDTETTDPVEKAIMTSGLQSWRKQSLISEYQRHLFEQGLQTG